MSNTHLPVLDRLPWRQLYQHDFVRLLRHVLDLDHLLAGDERLGQHELVVAERQRHVGRGSVVLAVAFAVTVSGFIIPFARCGTWSALLDEADDGVIARIEHLHGRRRPTRSRRVHATSGDRPRRRRASRFERGLQIRERLPCSSLNDRDVVQLLADIIDLDGRQPRWNRVGSLECELLRGEDLTCFTERRVPLLDVATAAAEIHRVLPVSSWRSRWRGSRRLLRPSQWNEVRS
jgi:hypothetical protein